MLSGSFYDIEKVSCDKPDDIPFQFCAVVSLHPDHPIFLGHFPGNPVVPGVCQVQMVTELVGKALKKPVRLTESDNIKFLSMINPLVNPDLEFTLLINPEGEEQISVTASVGSGASVFLKFKGKFKFAG